MPRKAQSAADFRVTKQALRVVKIDDIQYDASYQRDLVAGHKRIVSDFDPEALGIPVVGQREDGTLWCVDGRQRLAALKKLGRKEVRVEVFASKGPEHEAAVFSKINKNRTKLNAQQLFFAALTAGDEDAWAIKKICEAEGFDLPRGRLSETITNETAAKKVVAFQALNRIYRRGGEEALKFVLSTIKRVWEIDPMRTKGILLQGLYIFWLRHKGDVDQERLVPRLNTTTPAKIIYSAGMGIGGYETNIADVIEKIYRKRSVKALL
jgi:hypothetical protein